MIYAIFADVHGNLAALEAVISDAKMKGAEGFLLLGDYIRDTPNNNEIIEIIRSLPNCTAILGNGDKGVILLDETKPERCMYEQMYPNFWAYHDLSAQNLDYLKLLKDTADIVLSNGRTLHLSHSMGLVSHTPHLGIFNCGDYARKMESQPFSFDDGIREMQNTAEAYAYEVADYPGDICLYGHNHLQFLGSVGNKTLCNPGSCGYPFDYDTRAPYAILSDDDGEVTIELHRVKYDLDKTIAAIRGFADIPQLRIWMKFYIVLIKTGSNFTMAKFWQHASEVGGNTFPMDDDVWRKVVDTYQFEQQSSCKQLEDG